MNKISIFLLAAAVGLLPIALSYGLIPGTSMDMLFDIDASSVESKHIFRAVMGLYLALAGFWMVAAFRNSLQRPALWSLTLFMLGLAAGRSLSLLLDGMPNPLLMVYLGLEVVFGVLGVVLLKQSGKAVGD